jgi:hypothetical protein
MYSDQLARGIKLKVTISILSAVVMIIFCSCSQEVIPTPSVTHPPDWNDVNSTVFHGNKVMAAGLESCTQCHGTDYQGGSSGISCYECHTNYPHPDGWAPPGNGHAIYMQSINWQYQACQVCHGIDYRGGSSGSSCFTCHTEAEGLQACNLCHGTRGGSISDIASWAPPKDLMNNTATTAVGVGAHQKHLTGTTWSTAYFPNCTLCHEPISSYYDPNHIDSEEGVNMQFGAAATWQGKVSPQWDHSSATCADTYCHGNFWFNKSESANAWAYEGASIRGNNRAMDWTRVGVGNADCGTCHGLPPTGHILVPSCNPCHGSVVDANNNIIDKSKHINGVVDLN